MSKSIPISPKHGVNPTIPVCFWCGKENNEIALHGKIDKADTQAPMHCILDYEPCDACKTAMEQGVTLIGVASNAPDNRPPIQKGLYPTGQWAVLKTEAVSRLFPEDVAEKAVSTGKLLVEQSVLQQLLPAQSA